MEDEENRMEIMEEVADLGAFDPTKKKKKKKVVINDLADDSVDQLAEKTESLAVSDGVEPTFTGLKKKKKKQVDTEPLDEDKENNGEDVNSSVSQDEEGEGVVLEEDRLPWEGTDRDYKYEELLGRVFHILREHNPELAGDRRRTVMRPPQVLREGNKKDRFCQLYGAMQIHAQAARACNDLLDGRIGYKWVT